MLVVLSSATSAQRMVRVLSMKNIRAATVQTPKSISEGGCGYSVRIDEKYKDEALAAGKELRIAVKGIYSEYVQGNSRTYERRK